VVLGTAAESGVRSMEVGDLNWIGVDPPADGRIECRVQVRTHHRAAPAAVELAGANRARVRFDQPVSALTPGQGAAFYLPDAGGSPRDERLIGGGWIERTGA
jgi:tRNA-specific 2-thiouridylase